jgi:hypothetical protein
LDRVSIHPYIYIVLKYFIYILLYMHISRLNIIFSIRLRFVRRYIYMYTYNLYTLHYTNCTTLIAPL